MVELDRSEVARIASFNIKVTGDAKMSNATVVAGGPFRPTTWWRCRRSRTSTRRCPTSSWTS